MSRPVGGQPGQPISPRDSANARRSLSSSPSSRPSALRSAVARPGPSLPPPVSSLTGAREKPDFFTTWLTEYRRSVPRGERQALIDTTDLERALDRLSEKPLSLRVLRYRLTIYLAAAQALQQPVTPELGARRQALLKRMAAVFGLPVRAVAEDVRCMMGRLRLDHAAWLRHRDGASA